MSIVSPVYAFLMSVSIVITFVVSSLVLVVSTNARILWVMDDCMILNVRLIPKRVLFEHRLQIRL
jgi:hypothetical protein